MTMKMYAYSNGSQGATALAAALGIKKLLHKKSLWVAKEGDYLLNWGSSNTGIKDQFWRAQIINDPATVARAINKTRTFIMLSVAGLSCPEYTTQRQVALGWLRDGLVFARTTPTGKGGEGIVVASTAQEMPFCDLYTKHTPNGTEYRVHVVDGVVISFQQKGRKRDAAADPSNGLIKNHDNGYIFFRGGVVLPKGMKDLAIAGVSALGLDFGAVDMIYDGKKSYILEINTAPGIEGTTVEHYKEAFKKYA